MTVYYFAARYSRHPEMRTYRDQMEAAVLEAAVSSRWIDCHDDELEQSYTPEALNADPAGCWQHGQHDLEDLDRAEVIVSFTGEGGKGGRHIEHGYAIALHHIADLSQYSPTYMPMRLIIVGPRENIFHCHPDTEVYPDFAAFLEHEISCAPRPTASSGRAER